MFVHIKKNKKDFSQFIRIIFNYIYPFETLGRQSNGDDEKLIFNTTRRFLHDLLLFKNKCLKLTFYH